MGMPASLGVLVPTEVADWRESSSIVSVNDVVNIPHKLCRGHVGCCFVHDAAWWWDSRWVSLFEELLEPAESSKEGTSPVVWMGCTESECNLSFMT